MDETQWDGGLPIPAEAGGLFAEVRLRGADRALRAEEEIAQELVGKVAQAGFSSDPWRVFNSRRKKPTVPLALVFEGLPQNDRAGEYCLCLQIDGKVKLFALADVGWVLDIMAAIGPMVSTELVPTSCWLRSRK